MMTTCTHSYCTEPAQPGSVYCPGHAAVMYAPLAADAEPREQLAHALRWGVGGYDAAQLRRLDSIALVMVQSYPKDPEPHQAKVLETMNQLRHRIAAEQLRRTQAWARIAAQLADMDTDPDVDQDVIDQDQDTAPEMTDQERACKLLAAALTLIMSPPPPNGNGGGGRPVRPIRPGPTTPPTDGRALSLPSSPATARRGDDDIPF